MSSSTPIAFALNHMVAPQLDSAQFFALAKSLGLSHVEIRNDIGGKAILDGTPAEVIRQQAQDAGVTIVTINALQRFNDWSDTRAGEAIELADYAKACGALALILVPVNDGSGRGNGERVANAAKALAALKPILSERGLLGFVEPLGFEVCSLRSKREAVEAIDQVDGRAVFKITHDTFHHHLAGEEQLFPEVTGLVHISGVADPAVEVSDMADSHRGLVDAHDRVGNVDQLRALFAAGYSGPVSFEPFAADLAKLTDPKAAIGKSIAFIIGAL